MSKEIQTGFACTDYGNAERLEHYFGDSLLYVEEAKGWYCWTGTHWEYSNAIAEQKAASTARLMGEEASKTPDDRVRQEVLKWAARSESIRAVQDMLRMAQSAPALHTSLSEFDVQNWLLNVPNGTINLNTGAMHPHRREDKLTKMARVEYDPTAACPTWDKFINEVTEDNAELTSYLQRVAGSALSGEIREHVLHILFGPGGNGKSVFYETLLWVLKDYGLTTPVETLLRKANVNEGPTPELYSMRGARLVVAKEPDAGRRLSMSAIKILTGGDKVSARDLYKGRVEFYPTWTLMMSTNNELQVWETDDGTWGRILETPFDVKFRGTNKEDVELKEKLQKEGSGILRWMVEGCRSWKSGALRPPATVVQRTAAYKSDQDAIAHWIEERTEVSKESGVALTQVLLDDYEQTSKDTHFTVRTFAKELEKRQEEFNIERVRNPHSGFKGRKLKQYITIK